MPERAPSYPKPASLAEYMQWASDHLPFGFDETARTVTETNTASILNEVQNSSTLQRLQEAVSDCEASHGSISPQERLFASEPNIELFKKPYDSMVEKSFRHNVIWNRKWPSPPSPKVAGVRQAAEWTHSDNWYARYDDVVRGTLVLRYVDGPALVAAVIQEACGKLATPVAVEPRALDSGHYAVHVYFQLPVRLVQRNWNMMRASVWVELQLTTQLQDAARSLTHLFYEKDRLASYQSDEWKWEHGSDRFKSAYICHSLHLLDALIVDLRKSLRAPEIPKFTDLSSDNGGPPEPQPNAPENPDGKS